MNTKYNVKNTGNLYFSIIIIILFFSFYWFELRPSLAKKQCHHYAIRKAVDWYRYKHEDNKAFKKNIENEVYDLDDYEHRYKQCLKSKGI